MLKTFFFSFPQKYVIIFKVQNKGDDLMAFDGIVTKAIASELNELTGARIDKIFQPNKNNIRLLFRRLKLSIKYMHRCPKLPYSPNNTPKAKPKNRTRLLHGT